MVGFGIRRPRKNRRTSDGSALKKPSSDFQVNAGTAYSELAGERVGLSQKGDLRSSPGWVETPFGHSPFKVVNSRNSNKMVNHVGSKI